MKNHRQHSEHDSIEKQASAWFIRLRANDVSATERAQFEQWRQQSEKHAQAYENIVNMWASLKTPANNVQALLQNEHQSSLVVSKPYSAWLAVPLLLLLTVTFLHLPPLLQDWRSDYHTAAGEQLSTSLEDGSRVLLNTDTALTVAFSAGQRRIELLRGEAYFEVEPDKSRPFIVTRGAIHTRAVGTAFSVKTQDQAARVVVSEGIVEISAHRTKPLLLAEQQLSDYRPGRINTVTNGDIASEFSWQHGQLVFTQQTLGLVIDEVNRYHRGKIVIINPDIRQRIVSGVFDITAADAVIEALTSTLNVASVSLAGRLVLIY